MKEPSCSLGSDLHWLAVPGTAAACHTGTDAACHCHLYRQLCNYCSPAPSETPVDTCVAWQKGTCLELVCHALVKFLACSLIELHVP